MLFDPFLLRDVERSKSWFSVMVLKCFIAAGLSHLTPARRYLKLRSLGALAILLSFAMQHMSQGFKDSGTPLYATELRKLASVIALTSCSTLATLTAARLGSTPMVAFQISLQVWMISSLIANDLAIARQVKLLP